ncbi:MAG: hypothetical protein Kow0067_07040 [Coriobacteriia bacterium]
MYGAERSADEIREKVRGHIDSVKSRKMGRYAKIVEHMPKGGQRVLDFGCGWGYYAVAAAERGNTVVGIDHSANEIEICRLMWGDCDHLDLTFEQGDIGEFPDASFDTVISTSVLEHVHNPGLYLSQVNRVLREGGQLILSLPNVMTPRNARGALSKNLSAALQRFSLEVFESYDKTHHHINSWDPYHVTRLCASVGFRVDEFAGAEGLAMPRIPLVPAYVHTRIRCLEGFSYIMVFSLRKITDVRISDRD